MLQLWDCLWSCKRACRQAARSVPWVEHAATAEDLALHMHMRGAGSRTPVEAAATLRSTTQHGTRRLRAVHKAGNGVRRALEVRVRGAAGRRSWRRAPRRARSGCACQRIDSGSPKRCSSPWRRRRRRRSGCRWRPILVRGERVPRWAFGLSSAWAQLASVCRR
jgi:hypothetical protein